MKNEKSIDELTLEINTLMEENAKLKEQVSKSVEKKSENKEVKDLSAENIQLRELNEKLQTELKNAHQLVSNVLREYSTKTNDPSFFNGDDGKTQEQKELEKAQTEFSDFIKNI